VIAGGASFILDALRVGATGSVSALANVLPNEIIQLYNMHALEVNLKNSLKEGKSNFEEVTKNLQSLSENAQVLQNKLVGPDIAVNQ
jgi:dihydrodipicolinate synthase/N-acetylneuraminate lyase